MSPTTPTGLRERNKAEKRARILAAATDLFTRQGYAATTTQQVAEQAQVAVGTVFQYAGTKAELLLMVVNVSLAGRLEEATAAARRARSHRAAIRAVFDSLIDLVMSQPGSGTAFARELLLGEDGPHRDQSLALLGDLEVLVGSVLAAPTARRRLRDEVDQREAGRLVMSVLFMELARTRVGTQDAATLRQRTYRQLDVLLGGVLEPVPA